MDEFLEAQIWSIAQFHGLMRKGEIDPGLTPALAEADQALAKMPPPPAAEDPFNEVHPLIDQTVLLISSFSPWEMERWAEYRADDEGISIEDARQAIECDFAALCRMHVDFMPFDRKEGRRADDNYAIAVSILCSYWANLPEDGLDEGIKVNISNGTRTREKRKHGVVTQQFVNNEPVTDAARFVCDALECIIMRDRDFINGAGYAVTEPKIRKTRSRIATQMKVFIAKNRTAVSQV